MLDDEGEEIPGMRGYRYYGRAKDLPGVKEHLRNIDMHEQEQATARAEKYKRFQNQEGAYFGNEDEKDGVLLEEESASEQRGWDAGWTRVAEKLRLPDDYAAPAIPRPAPVILNLERMNVARDMPVKKAKKSRTEDTQVNTSALLNALDPQELVMPKTVDRKEIEAYLLQAKKAALRVECTYNPCFLLTQILARNIVAM